MRCSPYIPPKNRQLFHLGKAAVTAIQKPDLESIVADLKELGLYRLPYDVVDIRVLADDGVRWRAKDGSTTFPGPLGENAFVIIAGLGGPNTQIYIYQTDPVYWENVTDEVMLVETSVIFERWRDYLVALLATRNVRKTVTENKLAKLGIGKARWCYTTTLSLPIELERAVAHGEATGRTVIPHLRRGHIRRQHYGPNREAVKKIWIEPVFVNADEEFVSGREAYNVSRGAHP